MNHATAIKQINEQLQNGNQSKPYHTVARSAPPFSRGWHFERAQYNLTYTHKKYMNVHRIPFISYFDLNFADRSN